MFVNYGENLTFQIISQTEKDLAYLNSELPVSKEFCSSAPAFFVELGSYFEPERKNSFYLDNGHYRIDCKTLFHARSSLLIDDRYCIDFNGETLKLKIPRNKLSQRYLLLRIIYPLMRFYLLKKDILLLKASCTASNCSSTLYVGWSGAGKTTSVLNDLAVRKKYVSDTMSIITIDKGVKPVNNDIHVFWRNRKALNETIRRINLNKSEIQRSMYLKQLLHILTLKQKSLSTILNIPEEYIEKNETVLSKIFVVGPGGNIPHDNYTASELFNILYSINHYECNEFNRLLDILSYIGINVFENYWLDFSTKLRKLINSLIMEKQ